MSNKVLVDLSAIKEAQKKLDETIHAKHNVSYDKVYSELKLALLVELAELANEIRSFKFWSIKESSNKDIILDEYADGIHFISSLCIYYGIEMKFNIEQLDKVDDKKAITAYILYLFKKGVKLNSRSSVKKWFCDYLKFGMMIGFTTTDIIDAYNKKNKVNFNRQDNKY